MIPVFLSLLLLMTAIEACSSDILKTEGVCTEVRLRVLWGWLRDLRAAPVVSIGHSNRCAPVMLELESHVMGYNSEICKPCHDGIYSFPSASEKIICSSV